jgi:hypothetical protein
MVVGEGIAGHLEQPGDEVAVLTAGFQLPRCAAEYRLDDVLGIARLRYAAADEREQPPAENRPGDGLRGGLAN